MVYSTQPRWSNLINPIFQRTGIFIVFTVLRFRRQACVRSLKNEVKVENEKLVVTIARAPRERGPQSC